MPAADLSFYLRVDRLHPMIFAYCSMQLALDAQIPGAFGGLGAQALYVDSEGGLTPDRISTMASALVHHLHRIARLKGDPTRAAAAAAVTADSLLNGIHYYRIHDATAQVHGTGRLPGVPSILDGHDQRSSDQQHARYMGLLLQGSLTLLDSLPSLTTIAVTTTDGGDRWAGRHAGISARHPACRVRQPCLLSAPKPRRASCPQPPARAHRSNADVCCCQAQRCGAVVLGLPWSPHPGAWLLAIKSQMLSTRRHPDAAPSTHIPACRSC